MRLDSRKGDTNWRVYHARRCVVLRNVVWVDDETCQWCQYDDPPRVVGLDVASTVHQADRIVIDPSRRLIVIDPVEDAEDEQIERPQQVPETQP